MCTYDNQEKEQINGRNTDILYLWQYSYKATVGMNSSMIISEKGRKCYHSFFFLNASRHEEWGIINITVFWTKGLCNTTFLNAYDSYKRNY